MSSSGCIYTSGWTSHRHKAVVPLLRSPTMRNVGNDIRLISGISPARVRAVKLLEQRLHHLRGYCFFPDFGRPAVEAPEIASPEPKGGLAGTGESRFDPVGETACGSRVPRGIC